MLAIKLRRKGKKHQAFYRLVVAEKKSKLAGRFVEDLGFYNPHTKEMKINKERANYWIANGAKPTETANNLLVKEKVVEGEKVKAHSTRKRKKHLAREAEALKAKEAEAKAREEENKKETEEVIEESEEKKEEKEQTEESSEKEEVLENKTEEEKPVEEDEKVGQ